MKNHLRVRLERAAHCWGVRWWEDKTSRHATTSTGACPFSAGGVIPPVCLAPPFLEFGLASRRRWGSFNPGIRYIPVPGIYQVSYTPEYIFFLRIIRIYWTAVRDIRVVNQTDTHDQYKEIQYNLGMGAQVFHFVVVFFVLRGSRGWLVKQQHSVQRSIMYMQLYPGRHEESSDAKPADSKQQQSQQRVVASISLGSHGIIEDAINLSLSITPHCKKERGIERAPDTGPSAEPSSLSEQTTVTGTR